jgi:transcription elongation factor GreA
MTPDGYQKLQGTRKTLKVEAEEYKRYIKQGTHALPENAEYHAAKERQSFIEGRIQELKIKVALADVIDLRRFPRARPLSVQRSR